MIMIVIEMIIVIIEWIVIITQEIDNDGSNKNIIIIYTSDKNKINNNTNIGMTLKKTHWFCDKA